MRSLRSSVNFYNSWDFLHKRQNSGGILHFWPICLHMILKSKTKKKKLEVINPSLDNDTRNKKLLAL